MMANVAEKDPIFAEVVKVERDFWGDNRNRFIQWREEKHQLDALSELRSAERRGEARGEARGKVKGLAEGEARGKVKVARALLSKNTPFEFIQEVTGLSKDEILSLR